MNKQVGITRQKLISSMVTVVVMVSEADKTDGFGGKIRDQAPSCRAANYDLKKWLYPLNNIREPRLKKRFFFD